MHTLHHCAVGAPVPCSPAAWELLPYPDSSPASGSPSSHWQSGPQGRVAQQHAPSVRPVQRAPQLLLPLQPAAAQPPPAACVPAQLLPAALHDVSSPLPLPCALPPALLLLLRPWLPQLLPFVLLLTPCLLVQHGPSCRVLL